MPEAETRVLRHTAVAETDGRRGYSSKSCWPPLLFHMKPRRGSNFKYHFTVDCMSGQHSISSLGLWIFSFHRLAMIP